ncbi:hypothetical protein G5B30_12200 [Sphingobacterium sp. SGG-5]|uniref:MauE/DoxX family redox-associated membrane protein n=1 Tax=Sphingobacterium sp. SGG-5 TaxID=2710881 RepID=UPI0013EAC07B|nr:MauE/DoxX family redox-associated membrane protein [Sphingobacterium sp. SGG-5]NGM62677.1 hypothetical protein [Sphingobacterium sp. SGG-5]
MKAKYLLNIITIALLLLWIPVATEKLIDFTTFKHTLLRQPLPHGLTYMAIYTLPALEVLVVVMLVSPRWRQWGFLLSAILMALFTVYIGLALLGTWDRLPCACGSVISGMSWTQHFWFNLLFLGISVVGLLVKKRQHTSDPVDQVVG